MSFFYRTTELQARYFAFFVPVVSCNYSCTLDESNKDKRIGIYIIYIYYLYIYIHHLACSCYFDNTTGMIHLKIG